MDSSQDLSGRSFNKL